MGDQDPQKPAIEELRRLLDNQLKSLNDLQTKVGVALGFALTSLGILFSLGHPYLAINQRVSDVSAGLLVTSALLLGASYLSMRVTDIDPESVKTYALSMGADLKGIQSNLVTAYATAYDDNKAGTNIRFIVVNVAIALFLASVVLFVVGVLL